MEYKYSVYQIIGDGWEVPKDILNMIDFYVNEDYNERISIIEDIYKKIQIHNLMEHLKNPSIDKDLFVKIVMNKMNENIGYTFKNFLEFNNHKHGNSNFGANLPRRIFEDCLIDLFNLNIITFPWFWFKHQVNIYHNFNIYITKKAFKEGFITTNNVSELAIYLNSTFIN